ncbi:hypothetical protein DY000_02057424 [Brassica cretica]|uniref:Ribosomal RNA-processing protein 14/surfeit locus protein 6 C-terminal domain-containing protein n=1 Tax=Brassica cretica TaxID=69181 RepID=A0ABQ7A9C2_BRACR|nr:hypothetical protein DY000_02057424 [Brassica cretica]
MSAPKDPTRPDISKIKTRLRTQNTAQRIVPGWFLPLFGREGEGRDHKKKTPKVMGDLKVDDDAILKSFLAEVGEVERDNEVVSLGKSAATAAERPRKRLYSHPSPGCERYYHPHSWKELKMKRKKQLKKDTASKIKSLVDEGKHEQIYEQSEEFQKELKLKVREILTDQEWRRRKMAMRGRLKKDEEEQKEIRKKKREHEEQWEGTRENRVSSWRDFMKAGKKAKKGETRPPKLKTEDPNKSYVQRPVKKG